jgi:hypothetical protein
MAAVGGACTAAVAAAAVCFADVIPHQDLELQHLQFLLDAPHALRLAALQQVVGGCERGRQTCRAGIETPPVDVI